jgi:hypothetical protein
MYVFATGSAGGRFGIAKVSMAGCTGEIEQVDGLKEEDKAEDKP